MRQRLISAADWIGGVEAGVVVLAAPFLLFPTLRPRLTVGVSVALLLVWLVRWIAIGRPGTRTPLDVSLLLLMLMVPVAVWASALPELTAPKVTGLVLGLATFRATVNAVHTPRHLKVAVALFLALGLCLVTIGLVSTAWTGKWPALQPVLGRIPRLVRGLPGAEMGIHPNELAGTLLLFLPVTLAVVSMQGIDRRWLAWTVRVAALLLLLFFGTVLVLTQSRSAWVGVVVGLGVMLWVRWPHVRWLLIVIVLVLAFALWYTGAQAVLEALFPSAASGSAGTMTSTLTLKGRLELWNRALYAIQDFAFTGCGLGTFRRVVHVLYPLFLVSPGADIGHAHNVFLQVALDLGLPGLVAYLSLVGTALWTGGRIARASQPCAAVASSQFQWLALGIVGSLVAFHVYGLTDAIALGAKPGVAFWMLLALAAALWGTVQEAAPQAEGLVEASGAEGA